jgi:hypothetical protein
MSPTHIHLSRRCRKAIAGTAAAVALGGLLAACGSSTTTATTTAVPAAATSGASSGAHGTPRGLGKDVTGTAADKARAAALAKYPGTAERVMQLADGSYVVHVMRSAGGEIHVKVSKTFAVTGTQQGPPAGGVPTTSNGTSAQS